MNVWKDNYKKSVDGLKMPPHLKDKIIKDTPKRLARRRRKFTYARRLTGGAAYAAICCLLCLVVAGYQAEQSDSTRSGLPYPQVMVGDVSAGSNDSTADGAEKNFGRQTASPYIRKSSQAKHALAKSSVAVTYPGENIPEMDNGHNDVIPPEDLRLLKDFKIPSYIPDGYVMSNVNRKDKNIAQVTYESATDTMVYSTAAGVKLIDEVDAEKMMTYTVTVTDDGQNAILLRSDGGLCYDVIWVNDGNTYSVSSESGLAQETVSIIVESVNSNDR